MSEKGLLVSILTFQDQLSLKHAPICSNRAALWFNIVIIFNENSQYKFICVERFQLMNFEHRIDGRQYPGKISPLSFNVVPTLIYY